MPRGCESATILERLLALRCNSRFVSAPLEIYLTLSMAVCVRRLTGQWIPNLQWQVALQRVQPTQRLECSSFLGNYIIILKKTVIRS